MKFDIRVCQAIKIHRFQTLHQKTNNLLDKICCIKNIKKQQYGALLKWNKLLKGKSPAGFGVWVMNRCECVVNCRGVRQTLPWLWWGYSGGNWLLSHTSVQILTSPVQLHNNRNDNINVNNIYTVKPDRKQIEQAIMEYNYEACISDRW